MPLKYFRCRAVYSHQIYVWWLYFLWQDTRDRCCPDTHGVCRVRTTDAMVQPSGASRSARSKHPSPARRTTHVWNERRRTTAYTTPRVVVSRTRSPNARPSAPASSLALFLLRRPLRVSGPLAPPRKVRHKHKYVLTYKHKVPVALSICSAS